LEPVQLAVQIDGRGTRARLALHLLLALRPPGRGPVRRARVLAAGSDLLVVERQRGLVGARDQHQASSLSLGFMSMMYHITGRNGEAAVKYVSPSTSVSPPWPNTLRGFCGE